MTKISKIILVTLLVTLASLFTGRFVYLRYEVYNLNQEIKYQNNKILWGLAHHNFQCNKLREKFGIKEKLHPNFRDLKTYLDLTDGSDLKEVVQKFLFYDSLIILPEKKNEVKNITKI